MEDCEGWWLSSCYRRSIQYNLHNTYQGLQRLVFVQLWFNGRGTGGSNQVPWVRFLTTAGIHFPLFLPCKNYTVCFFLTYTDTRTPPATSPQNPSAVVIAQRSVQRIKGKFSMLVTKSRRKLQSRKVDVDDVQTFLVTLYSSPNSKDGSDTVTVVVESARNLSEIFRAVSRYGLWDYLNYYLLQDMIEEFAHDDDELNRMMQQYQKDLTGHILTLQIQTYLDATHDELPLVSTNDSENSDDETIPAFPPEQKYKCFKKLTGKIKANVTDHTLKYIIDLWRSLTNQFALPRPAVILHNIAEGCIAITWLIPVNLVKHIIKMAQETANMFAEEQILRVTLEKRYIYPMETRLSSEPTLLETKPSRLQNEPCLLETETTALKRKVCCMHVGVCEK